ncbi:MAG: sugar transporter [Chlorobi bacterium]|nr:sugar transporter [Chlorobiota bacterium]
MMKYVWWVLILPAVVLSSCTSQKQLIYLQNLDTSTGKRPAMVTTSPEYRIRINDILYIRVLSLDPEINQMYNPLATSGQQNLYNTEQSYYIYGYSVNDSGKVSVPFLGEIAVANLTLEQAHDTLQKRVNQVLRNADVIVKLISFKYSVLGEVAKPGMYTNFNNQLTILEALSKAGDITEFGNRKRVLVLRPGENEPRIYRMDLTGTDFLASEGFFLQPNDIVYVEPIKNKSFRINIPTISVFLSSISALILVLSFVTK